MTARKTHSATPDRLVRDALFRLDNTREGGGTDALAVLDKGLQEALDIQDRHVSRNGLCGWCCCEWPCDAVILADIVEGL